VVLYEERSAHKGRLFLMFKKNLKFFSIFFILFLSLILFQNSHRFGFDLILIVAISSIHSKMEYISSMISKNNSKKKE
jgi:phosphatidylglycerophosphate synthase